jgi:hypothetical protein
MTIDSQLIEATRTKSLILFVGSGVSRNLGLPTFSQLADVIAEELGYDPEVFKLLGGYLELAEYYEIQKLGLGALRSKLDKAWHDPSISIENSYVHRLLPELQAPLVYTTNYDHWIESAYRRLNRRCTPIVTIADLRKVEEGVPQIIKFHGDFTEDTSIVLTESSYFERLDFESPLDLKLRADALGRSILFLGYSLTDINIRLLMFKLNRLWEAPSVRSARPQSYIVLSRPNPVQEAVLRSRGIEPIVTPGDDPGRGLEEFLSELVTAAHGISVDHSWD